MNMYIVMESGKGELKAVKQGFSWPAFLCSPLWALWHGMGFLSLLLALAGGTAWGLAWVVSLPVLPAVAAQAFAVLAVIPGMVGNVLLEDRLMKGGWKVVGREAADGPEEACRAHLRNLMGRGR